MYIYVRPEHSDFMTVQVRFFASLKQQLAVDAISIQPEAGMTATRAWQLATGDADLPANTLCAINLEYADMSTAVRDGDEVAFFPPVTGG